MITALFIINLISSTLMYYYLHIKTRMNIKFLFIKFTNKKLAIKIKYIKTRVK